MAIFQQGSWGWLGPLGNIDLGLTERLGIGKPNSKVSYGGALLKQPAPVLGAATSQVQPNYSQASSGLNYTPVPQQSYQPSTGGQPASGGTAGAGAGFAPTDASTAPAGPDPSQYLNELRSAFGSLRSNIEGQLPGLEADYNRIKGDVEGAVGRARETRDERRQEIQRGFGENLKNLLSSNRELEQRQQGVFSGLNALDSSAYADAQIKAQQNLFDTQGRLETERTKTTNEANRQFEDYESQATGMLADLGNQYLSARSALQTALAQNRLDEATSIQNAMQQIQAQASQIQNTMANFSTNLLGLQAQGVDVVGNLNKLGAGGLNNIYGSYLSRFLNPTMSNYFIPQSPVAGQGYIGSSEEEKRKLLGM